MCSNNKMMVISPLANINISNGQLYISVFYSKNPPVLFDLKGIDILKLFAHPKIEADVLNSFSGYEKDQLSEIMGIFRKLGVLVPVIIDRGIPRPQFRWNTRSIELDITWKCPRSCINCNRSLREAPTEEYMTLAQVHQFIRDAREKNRDFALIKIAGGEPSEHINFQQIVEELLDNKSYLFPQGILKILTSVSDKFPHKIQLLEKKGQIIIEDSNKKNNYSSNFHHIHMAPLDSAANTDRNYKEGCILSAMNGLGLTPFGYYSCPIMGSIDRVLGFDIGRKKLPNIDDLLYDQLDKLCCYCGMVRQLYVAGDAASFSWEKKGEDGHIPKKSQSWVNAFEQYSRCKPELSRF